MSFYKDRHDYNDGKIVLFTRTDNSSGIWYARLKRPDKGYVTVSTKTKDLEKAKDIALDKSNELAFKHKYKMPIKTRSFEYHFNEWLEEKGVFMKEQRKQHHADVGRRYFFEYFNRRDFSVIDEQFLDEYWPYRMTYWTLGPGLEKKRHTNVVDAPSVATLYLERDTLNQFFKWAERRKLVARKPQIEMPMKFQRNNRPGFESDEYDTLFKTAWKWVQEAVDRPHMYYERAVTYYMCMLVGQSGLRPGEVKKLRWKDITPFISDEGEELIAIHVSPDTKTGHRICVPLKAAKSTINQWYAVCVATELYRLHKQGVDVANENELKETLVDVDDYIFRTYSKNKKVIAHGRGVAKMLEMAGLQKDRFDRFRSLYSFRHTYATFRLLKGDNVDIHSLAINMGTSVEMIEKHYAHVTPQQQAVNLTSMKEVKSKKKHAEVLKTYGEEIITLKRGRIEELDFTGEHPVIGGTVNEPVVAGTKTKTNKPSNTELQTHIKRLETELAELRGS